MIMGLYFGDVVMIMDKIENLGKYLEKDVVEKIRPFVSSISADMADGEYDIDGEHIFARVMAYETMPKEECKIEAHNRYIDIQFTLAGAEGIDVFPRSQLQSIEDYSVEDDVEWFSPDEETLFVQSCNLPGYFTMLFPYEAHRPKESVAGFSKVKKGVIKLEVDEYEPV